jgi:hypothetical protein
MSKYLVLSLCLISSHGLPPRSSYTIGTASQKQRTSGFAVVVLAASP